MRILHLVSYSLYSGPLPSTLALAVEQRRQGHEVWLAHDSKRGAINDYEEAADPWLEGLSLTPPLPLTLSAKSTVGEYLHDRRHLQRLLRQVDVVHTHLSHDHGLLDRFVDRCMGFVDAPAIRGLRVVLDAANGMAGVYLPPVLERIDIDAVPFFLEPDGRFPHHEPNPLLEENRAFIEGAVVENGADVGIAWDGDADRCFFIDEKGGFVAGDFLTALLARHILERVGPATVVYDLRASWAVRDSIIAAGGTPDEFRVGHAFIKRRMREVDAVFAGEVSGHYYFREFSYADSGLIPALMVLEILATSGQTLSEMVQALRERYHISGEINSTVDDAGAAIDRLRARYADGRQAEVDGLSVAYDDWHFNVRPSNTEPLLRLNLESLVSEADMERRRDEVLEIIREG